MTGVGDGSPVQDPLRFGAEEVRARLGRIYTRG